MPGGRPVLLCLYCLPVPLGLLGVPVLAVQVACANRIIGVATSCDLHHHHGMLLRSVAGAWSLHTCEAVFPSLV